MSVIRTPDGTEYDLELEEIIPFGEYRIRKLALLLLAFEGEFDKLLANHAGYITQSVGNLGNSFSDLMTEHFPQASGLSNAGNPILRHLSDKAKLDRIWAECSSADEIIDTMCPAIDDRATYPNHPGWHSKYKYNFLPLRPSPAGAHIEIRHHHSTLNSTEMIHWILLIGNVIKAALHLNEPDLLRLVHYNDTRPVNLTELFVVLCSVELGYVELTDMMQYYSRRTRARGTRLRMDSGVKFGSPVAGARKLKWRVVKAGEVRRPVGGIKSSNRVPRKGGVTKEKSRDGSKEEKVDAQLQAKMDANTERTFVEWVSK